jgi:hypothetical protein
MFLKISKSKQPLLVFFIPVIGLLLWLKAIFGYWPNLPFDYSSHQMPLFSIIEEVLHNLASFSCLISCILVIICAVLLNRLNIKFILIAERTYLPAIFYIILSSSYYQIQKLNPALFSSVFLLFAIERVLDTYKLEHLAYEIFDAAFFIGVASLFHFNAIYFVIYIWAGLIIMRPFYWREWVYSVLGIVVPYIILFSIYYLADIHFDKVWTPIKYSFIETNHAQLNYQNFILFGYFIFIFIAASIHMVGTFPVIKILARRAFNLLLIFFWLSVIIWIFIPGASFEMLYIASIPVSLLFSHYFVTVKSKFIYEIFFDLLVLMIIALQFIVK